MNLPDRGPSWRKSSASADQKECVEVLLDAQVGVRDTKDRAGGELAVKAGAWDAFTSALKR